MIVNKLKEKTTKIKTNIRSLLPMNWPKTDSERTVKTMHYVCAR